MKTIYKIDLFLLIYIIVIENSIVNILLSSPSSIHWGYACDRIFDKGLRQAPMLQCSLYFLKIFYILIMLPVTNVFNYFYWENIQKYADAKFKETGVKNLSMPLLIPEHLLNKEKDM